MKNKGKILVVDDNEEILVALKLFLNDYFETIITEKNPNKIPAHAENRDIDLYILDMNFSAGQNTGNEGIFWMNKILEIDPEAIVIFITAYGDIELSVKAIKQGATDFIQKPWEDEKLLGTILSAYKLRKSKLKVQQLINKQQHISEAVSEQYSFFIGESKVMKKVWNTIQKVSHTDANILILGENGTGKELIAREIHKQSAKAKELFVKVDIAALTESLFESELFGHKKGAFTDAREDRAGRFELANGGSLFLDEIGNISLGLQSKLLTVLQNRVITRLGTNNSIPVDIRLICATNKSLYEMVSDSRFREDLLYRINTIQIEVPALRDRPEDIPFLVDMFLKKYAKKYSRSNLIVSKAAINKLYKHSWPGNIRELEHIVEKAVIMSDSDTLSEFDFVFSGKTSSGTYTINLEENEKKLIGKALERHMGNQSLASKELGITRKTLYNKIKKYGL